MPLWGSWGTASTHLCFWACMLFILCWYHRKLRHAERERAWERGWYIQHKHTESSLQFAEWREQWNYWVTYNGVFFRVLQKKGPDPEKETTLGSNASISWVIKVVWSSRLSGNLRLYSWSIRKCSGHNHDCLPRSREKEWWQEVRTIMQDWLGWSSCSPRDYQRVFSSTTIWKHQFFGAQSSLRSNSCIRTYLVEKL